MPKKWCFSPKNVLQDWLLVVLICLDMVSICLDMVSTVKKITSRPSKSLDSSKNDISTSLDMVYALKSRFVSIFNTVSIETLGQDSRSRLLILTFSKPCLDKSRRLNLDLDWSRLCRPPGLIEHLVIFFSLYSLSRIWQKPLFV